jgi:DNA polymerase III delta prime subunit
MEQLNVNTILNRDSQAAQIKEILREFENNKHNPNFKKGFYVCGDPGTGKTTFVVNILNELGYDIVKYDAGDIRNKSVIDEITERNMSDKNIMSMFNKKVKKIAIIMDEIDGMNNGDKGGINTLIKLIRPKKTKKQKLEEVTMNPIICIGNYRVDKKIKELMKVCNTVDLKTPTISQIKTFVNLLLPTIDVKTKDTIVSCVQGDLRKLSNIYNLYRSNPSLFSHEIVSSVFQMKSYNDDTKKITQRLINEYCPLDDHTSIMNETDRTSVGLLWHENIIDILDKMDKKVSVPFYIQQLDNICFADYIDRITFQKQIWQFNEMSSLMKTMSNNKMYHEHFPKKAKFAPTEVRFTKVLTKYSTEYNNSLFIQNLCQQLGMDKKDLFGFFVELKSKYDDSEMLELFENLEITKLDINRIYRYLDKYTKENAPDTEDKEIIELEQEIEEECCV